MDGGIVGARAGGRRRPSLRSRLVLLVLALTLPALAAGGLTLYGAYRRDRLEVQKHLQETTRALSLVVDRHFGQAEALLWALATSPQLEAGDFASFDARARAAMRLPESWVVVEERGRQVVNTSLPPGSALPRLDDQSHWNGLEPGKTRISNVFTGLVASAPTVGVDTLIAGPDGAPRFAVSVLMPASTVSRILEDQRLPASWIGAINDRNGIVVARSREAARFVGRSTTANTVARIQAKVAEAVFESTSLDGVATVVALNRSAVSGWSTVVAVPRAELTATARWSALYLAGTGWLLVAGGLVMAGAVARVIARTVEDLARAATALADGRAEPPEPSGSDFAETASVREALTCAAAALRQREAELRRLNEGLEERVAARTHELAQANARLLAEMEERRQAERQLSRAQRLEAVGQLTGGLAHDFNNLLTAVLGSLEMLGRRLGSGLDDRSRRLISNATEAAERGARLTQQLLAFSRRQRLEPKTTDVNASVDGVVTLLRSTLGGTVRVETRLRADLWPALADPTQLELIVLNLALNARDSMPLGGALTVETTNVVATDPATPEEPAAGEYVMVAVSDTGTGMPPDVLARVFEPFFTTKEVGKGSGLGLSQVLGIAKQLGGGVRIETRAGEGTSVQVYLPRAREALGAVPAVLPERPHAELPLAGRRILVVDDDGDVRQVVVGMLREAGAVVSEAASGLAAIEHLEAAPEAARPHLTLLDYAMPGLTGTATARRLKALAPAMPLLMMTGYAEASALPEAGEVDAVIGKPFRMDELVARLIAVLGEATPATGGKVVLLRGA
ncbi:MAG TPA: ATP-binding protein [Beijerinckiaceae bacterium]